jgi:hypothetical protein
MGNICSTRDEKDLREQAKEKGAQNGDNNSAAISQKNVFKTNPKGKYLFTLKI